MEPNSGVSQYPLFLLTLLWGYPFSEQLWGADFSELNTVLSIFGAEDQQILKEDVLEFEAALNSLDIENEITFYDGVGHAFVSEDNYNKPGPAMDAWQQTLAFLEANLMGSREDAAK